VFGPQHGRDRRIGESRRGTMIAFCHHDRPHFFSTCGRWSVAGVVWCFVADDGSGGCHVAFLALDLEIVGVGVKSVEC
jgi:hypothetical protein